MPAAIVARSESTFTIQVEVPYGSSMLDAEETLQQRLNEAGTLATGEILRRFDADGSPIQVGDTKLTSKGKLKKEYQTPTVSHRWSGTSTRAAGAAGPTARWTCPSNETHLARLGTISLTQTGRLRTCVLC